MYACQVNWPFLDFFFLPCVPESMALQAKVYIFVSLYQLDQFTLLTNENWINALPPDRLEFIGAICMHPSFYHSSFINSSGMKNSGICKS